MKNFVNRDIARHLREVGQYFPVISLTGPRQAGKTTLLREIYPDYKYVSFENPKIDTAFKEDPEAFLNEYNQYVIFDEAQNVPELFSYLQGMVDDRRTPSRFILSGSQNFLLRKNITQSLAGRVVPLTLFPLDQNELTNSNRLSEYREEAIFKGGYPGLEVTSIPPSLFYSAYLQNYIERDVKGLIDSTNLTTFKIFIRVCASFSGQLMNYSTISKAVGVSVPTIKSWLSILEQSYLTFTLSPYFRNFKKRLVKSPKLYFYDTGLLCYLLDIESPEMLGQHMKSGAIFENYVVSEVRKMNVHRGKENKFYFYRDSTKLEVDLVEDGPFKAKLWEIKSTSEIGGRQINNLKLAARNFDQLIQKGVIYGGGISEYQNEIKFLAWNDLRSVLE
ncbi:MAG: ATP-binding protein [Bacteroidota bacterium]